MQGGETARCFQLIHIRNKMLSEKSENELSNETK